MKNNKLAFLFAALSCLIGILGFVLGSGSSLYYANFVLGALWILAYFYDDVKRT